AQGDHDRGAVGEGPRRGPARLDRGGRGPVRLLPAGADHVGGGAARRQARPERRRHRRRHVGQPLPLRHLPPHPRGGAQGGGPRARWQVSLDRRQFIQTSAGLVIGLYVAPRRLWAAEPAPAAKPLPDANAFLQIAPDDTVTIRIAHSEMGQGIWTTLPMLVAEELGCDWTKIKVEHAPASDVYAHTAFHLQMTGGSTTTWAAIDRYLWAGAG